jgi:hypothetical protein
MIKKSKKIDKLINVSRKYLLQSNFRPNFNSYELFILKQKY